MCQTSRSGGAIIYEMRPASGAGSVVRKHVKYSSDVMEKESARPGG